MAFTQKSLDVCQSLVADLCSSDNDLPSGRGQAPDCPKLSEVEVLRRRTRLEDHFVRGPSQVPCEASPAELFEPTNFQYKSVIDLLERSRDRGL
jgi:hypothetical protein